LAKTIKIAHKKADLFQSRLFVVFVINVKFLNH